MVGNCKGRTKSLVKWLVNKLWKQGICFLQMEEATDFFNFWEAPKQKDELSPSADSQNIFFKHVASFFWIQVIIPTNEDSCLRKYQSQLWPGIQSALNKWQQWLPFDALAGCLLPQKWPLTLHRAGLSRPINHKPPSAESMPIYSC